MEIPAELVQLSAAADEPLTTDAAKLWLRVEDDTDDDLIASLCVAAREYAETFCRRSFKVGDVWQLKMNQFPVVFGRETEFYELGMSELWENELEYLSARPERYAISIPMGPISAVTSIVYLDTTGAAQTLDPSKYQVVGDDYAATRVFPVYPNWWPQTRIGPGGVTVLFTASGAMPAGVLTAMKQLLAHWYRNREAVSMAPGVTPQSIPLVAERLLWPYRFLEV